MSIDLTIQSARSQRDSLASRTEVLDKVKALSLLPNDLHATTEQVATYFEVDADTIRWHVRTSRDELDSDAYRVVTRSIFETEFGSLSNLDPKVRQIALFPRRAILRIAMLLRDSTVARRVRDHLLDVESSSREMGEDEIVLRALQIQGRKIEALTERVAELEPKAEYVDLFVTDSDVLSFSTVASTLDMQASKLRELLIEHGWIFKETATRWSNSKGRKEDVNRYSEYSHKKPYFRRIAEHDIPRFRGEVMHTLKFTPEGANAVARMIPRWTGELVKV